MKTRWGILSTANIGIQKVIPAIQNATNCVVTAISSRSEVKSRQAATELNIPKVYGSYGDMLADPEIDIIYNPLPNHLHVSYTIKALQAGKHVLCEKPLGMNSKEVEYLMEVSKEFPQLKVMEAFMYRFHPQWKKVKEIIENGALGEVKSIHSHFSFFNTDPENTRNILEIGGGALLDIGCYCVSFPRYIYGREPERVLSLIDRDPLMKIDRLTSGIMDFGEGKSATFTCSIQMMYGQWCEIMGTAGRIEVDIPVNAPNDRETKITLITNDRREEYVFDKVDQYTLQAEAFAKAVIEDHPVPTPLTDALGNMRVIDALFKSSEQSKWVKL
jgi:predicted dehydrogenase